MDDLRQLPPDVLAKFLGFITEVDGEYQVKDQKGFIDFVYEYRSQYPFLESFLQLNEEAVMRHCEETGEAPPGVKITIKTVTEGSNVIGLTIIDGSRPSKKSD
jgi:hypothetical protein